MNIIMILSGGTGKRFGSVVPKQYNIVLGRPVIDYVIDAVSNSKICDKVVVVIDEQYIPYSDKLSKSNFDFVPNGSTRLESINNGLDYIQNNYSCEKIVIVDAVAPFIYGELLDEYFNKLDAYSAVITAQEITGGFTDKNNTPLNRENYIITQSPEGFRFNELYNNFDVNFPYQEVACMLPKDAKRYYNYEFKNNLKLTYDFELNYIETMLKEHGKAQNNSVFFDKNILFTDGIRKSILKNKPIETNAFIDKVYTSLSKLIDEYQVSAFIPNQRSSYGLVIEAESANIGPIIFKFIPDFIGRYEREVEAYKILSNEFMCELIDTKDEFNALILKKVNNPRYATFEENIKLTSFFDKVFNNAKKYDKSMNIQYTPFYFDELNKKLELVDTALFCKEEIREELNSAVELYNKTFKDEELYYIHLDLHNYNLLNDGNQIYAVDPNGSIAPLVFEFVKFIRNDVRQHKEFGYEQRFKLLIDYFSKYCNKENLIKAFLIDLAFCNFNSTFENDNDCQTKLNIEIFNMAKKLLKEY